MGDQLTTNAEALRLFFTEDVYLVNTDEITRSVDLAAEESALPVAGLPPAEEMVTAKTIFNYLGKNQRNVLILVHDGQNEVSTELGRELLRNIVKAIQLSANDFALLNYANYAHTEFTELIAFFSSKLVLVFGVTPLQLGLAEYPRNVLVREEAIQLIFSENLDLLSADQNGKKQLWGSLKQLSI